MNAWYNVQWLWHATSDVCVWTQCNSYIIRSVKFGESLSPLTVAFYVRRCTLWSRSQHLGLEMYQPVLQPRLKNWVGQSFLPHSLSSTPSVPLFIPLLPSLSLFPTFRTSLHSSLPPSLPPFPTHPPFLSLLSFPFLGVPPLEASYGLWVPMSHLKSQHKVLPSRSREAVISVMSHLCLVSKTFVQTAGKKLWTDFREILWKCQLCIQ